LKVFCQTRAGVLNTLSWFQAMNSGLGGRSGIWGAAVAGSWPPHRAQQRCSQAVLYVSEGEFKAKTMHKTVATNSINKSDKQLFIGKILVVYRHHLCKVFNRGK
jgi:hypothetical protein